MKIVKPLTCCCDAVKAHEGVEAGGSTRQNTTEAKRSKTTHAKFFVNTVWQKKKEFS